MSRLIRKNIGEESGVHEIYVVEMDNNMINFFIVNHRLKLAPNITNSLTYAKTSCQGNRILHFEITTIYNRQRLHTGCQGTMEIKVKISLCRPWSTLGLREVEAPTFSDIRLIDSGKVVSPTRLPLSPPGRSLVLIFVRG
jgi:hypothetical protein